MLRQYKTPPKNTALALKRAKGIVKQGWCQGNFSQDAYGKPVDALSDRAESCCAEGALYRAFGIGLDTAPDDVQNLLGDALTKLDSCIQTISIIGFNDRPNRKKEEVLALFDKAIERAKDIPA